MITMISCLLCEVLNDNGESAADDDSKKLTEEL